MNFLLTKKISILALTCILSISSYAQSTYVGGGIGLSRTYINKTDIITGTVLNSIDLNIEGIHRPIERLGIGMNISIPLGQTNNFNFNNFNFSIEEGFTTFSSAYQPSEFDYTFRQKAAATIFGRIFFDSDYYLYCDIKLNYTQIDEDFVIHRPSRPAIYSSSTLISPEIEALNYTFSDSHSMVYPGIRVGAMPQSDNFYFDINFNIDVVTMQSDGFSYSVSYAQDYGDDQSKYVNLEGQGDGKKLKMSANIGMGCYF